MITDDLAHFRDEITVQDKAADEYQSKRYSSKYARMYHDWWTDLMLKHITIKGRVLDNGCGVGYILERFGPDNAVGMDLSMNMLRHAAKRFDKLVLGSSQQLPFKANTFDIVFCRGLLHHLPDPELGIREIHRVLRPNGQVVIVDPNDSFLSRLPRKIARGGEHFADDHKSFSKTKLEKMLEPCFTIDKIEYFGYVAYPLLAFPDLLDIFKYVPFKPVAAKVAMGLDSLLAKTPLVRAQSWAILAKATALAVDKLES